MRIAVVVVALLAVGIAALAVFLPRIVNSDAVRERIQTAAEIPTFEFDNVPQPQQVASLINQLLMEEELEKLEGRVR